MFHHVSVAVSDIDGATRFYDEVLATLGYHRLMSFLPKAVAYGEATPVFWVQVPPSGSLVRPGRGGHIAFDAKSKEAVDAFHARALALGATDNGPPGPRPNYGPRYYGAFVIDPDGNRLEAVLLPMAPMNPPARQRKPAKAKASKAKAKAKTTRKTPAKSRPAKKATAKRRPTGRKSGGRRPTGRGPRRR